MLNCLTLHLNPNDKPLRVVTSQTVFCDQISLQYFTVNEQQVK